MGVYESIYDKLQGWAGSLGADMDDKPLAFRVRASDSATLALRHPSDPYCEMTDDDLVDWMQSYLLPEVYNPEWALAFLDWNDVATIPDLDGEEEIVIMPFQTPNGGGYGPAPVTRLDVVLNDTEEEFWDRVRLFREARDYAA